MCCLGKKDGIINITNNKHIRSTELKVASHNMLTMTLRGQLDQDVMTQGQLVSSVAEQRIRTRGSSSKPDTFCMPHAWALEMRDEINVMEFEQNKSPPFISESGDHGG